MAVFVGLVGGGKAVSIAVLLKWASAYVSGTVTSHASGFPLDHGRIVVPSGAFSVLSKQAHWLFDWRNLGPFHGTHDVVKM